MERLLYRDVQGEIHQHNETSVHHLWSESYARRQGLRKWVNQRGLLYRMINPLHLPCYPTSVHSNVSFPPLPSHDLRADVTQFLKTHQHENPYDTFIDLLTFFEDGTHTQFDTNRRRECERIADNLQQQAPYIFAGQVQLIEVQEVTV